MLHPGCAGPCLVPIWMRSIFELKKNGGTQNPRLYPREFQVPFTELCCGSERAFLHHGGAALHPPLVLAIDKYTF